MKQKNSFRKLFIHILFVFVIATLILSFCACTVGSVLSERDKDAASVETAASDRSSASDTLSRGSLKKTGVIVSILPLAGFAENVGRDLIDVTVMVPPGASPHTYEPTPGQLQGVSDAAIYAKVGSGVEFELAWMGRIAGMNRNMTIVDCSKGISLIGNDPHIWLSVKNVAVMVENIYEGLIEADPANRDFYYNNKSGFQEKLELLDMHINEILKDKENRKILVLHPSWTYFAADYQILQVAIESEGKEPTIKEMKAAIQLAREYDIKVIFASPEFSTRSAETIADEIGGTVVLVSPLEKDYIKNMEKIATAFAESMR